MPQQSLQGTDLELALAFVMDNPKDFHHRQRFHKVFLRTKFYLPTLKDNPLPTEEYFPLRLYENNNPFFIVFDTKKKYESWLSHSPDTSSHLSFQEIFGHELIDCLGTSVYLGLNPGTQSYFELNPTHIQFLKTVIEKTKNPKRVT